MLLLSFVLFGAFELHIPPRPSFTIGTSRKQQQSFRPTLDSLPEDLIRLIAARVVDVTPIKYGKVWGEEQNEQLPLLPLSVTCKHLRACLKSLIFKTVHNWNIDGKTGSEGSLSDDEQLCRTVHMRDHAIRHEHVLEVDDGVYEGLAQMPALQRVVMRYKVSLPPAALQCLPRIRHLTSLEIYQARLDGPVLPPLEFPLLEKLLLIIAGFRGVIRAPEIDKIVERANVGRLLRSVSGRLSHLHVSGDLLPDDFGDIRWQQLQKLVVSEHSPATYLLVPALTARMPTLRALHILYAADMSRPADELHPPFVYGDPDGKLLVETVPHLTSLSLSNLTEDDPVFSQLPASLTALHLHAWRDPYYGRRDRLDIRGETALTNASAMAIVLNHLSNLTHLLEFTVVLNEFPAAPLLEAIATTFPSLVYLEISHATYGYPRERREELEDARDPTIIAPLARLHHLRTLRITLNMLRNRFDRQVPILPILCWLFDGIPSLETAQFSWFTHFSWVPARDPEWRGWNSYDRAYMIRELAKPPPPRRILKPLREIDSD
ncbi:unnamed protein product [Mycena citricolor]|uniref:F-box domain-containing protein n=1 Tax=Mycena citricolor TaxID=2018698 RepID=A0AAD2Q7V0_9AGAR|nr:unnamed protein product [Mycena citricolor]